ncbi:MAG: shikimate kinase [Clostridia bacterium]|nr:shikimate kinase [Clostridia bacterium]
MSIILIGLPSSGKSTLGVLLAKSMGYKFIDADIVIQERQGRLLHEIIDELGPEGFIEIENEINQSITDTKAVIATGGSAVYGEKAMEHFKTLGKVVYIKIPFETMEQRLGDYAHRGVAIKAGMTLRDMYEERIPLYEKYADITIEGLNTMHQTVTSLVEGLKL